MERVRSGEGVSGEPVDGATIEQLAAGERMSTQTYAIEPGVTVPEHSHENEQVGVVIQGTLVLETDEKRLTFGPGDSYAIPGGEPHVAHNPGETTVRGVELFSPPRTGRFWEDDG
jgi:quercetin dioxygenase-like cupin family protein